VPRPEFTVAAPVLLPPTVPTSDWLAVPVEVAPCAPMASLLDPGIAPAVTRLAAVEGTVAMINS
jgi:hypothetical protein